MPLGTLEFSILVAIAMAVLVVGVITFLVGQCLVMPRIGHSALLGFVPGYNLYLIFSAARCQTLLVIYLIDAVCALGFWLIPAPEVQELVWWCVGIGVLLVMWCVLALAQRMHLDLTWQLAAFFLPSFTLCLMGLTNASVDDECYPQALLPLKRLGQWWREHPWTAALRQRVHDEELPRSARMSADSTGELSAESTGELATSAATTGELGAGAATTGELGDRTDSQPTGDDGIEGEEPTMDSGPIFEGREFDPEGDAAAERADDEALEKGAEPPTPVEEPMAEEPPNEEPKTEEPKAQEPKKRAHRPRHMRKMATDDDASDEIEGQIEARLAEHLGHEELTQDVDDVEAEYMERDAELARETVLEETHDAPNPHGAAASALEEAVVALERDEDSPKTSPSPKDARA